MIQPDVVQPDIDRAKKAVASMVHGSRQDRALWLLNVKADLILAQNAGTHRKLDRVCRRLKAVEARLEAIEAKIGTGRKAEARIVVRGPVEKR